METPGTVDMTKEEKLLQALLGANDELVAVFKVYEDFEAAANAEEEMTMTRRGGAEQTTDSTVRAFWPRYLQQFDIASTTPGKLF